MKTLMKDYKLLESDGLPLSKRLKMKQFNKQVLMVTIKGVV